MLLLLLFTFSKFFLKIQKNVTFLRFFALLHTFVLLELCIQQHKQQL